MSMADSVQQESSIANRWWALSSTSAFVSIFFVLLFVSATLIINWADLSKISGISFLDKLRTPPPVNCINGNSTCLPQTPKSLDLLSPSPSPSPSYSPSPSPPPMPSCPEYFRWIHEDLKPWKGTGITRDMVERGRNLSDFRLVIVNGKAYVEQYRRSYQTRDVFTLWGISQLLRLYPGQVPNLELMFQCGDLTVVKKKHFTRSSSPPVFHYCGDDKSFDLVFPDWSFWGWAELNIKPWEATLKNIEQSNEKMKWKDRIPYAFWKGNPDTGRVRKKLTKCNASRIHDWNARIYPLFWDKEIQQNFQNTKLEDQCTHRYKIYAEGNTWSVSEKYILACDSMSMFIKPKNFDFYTRSLVPMQHYWPIGTKYMCRDIKFAVDWGNFYTDEAQKIGSEGTNFLHENVTMKLVYDYMFHVLKEYASLLRFKPIIPAGATELCSDIVNCPSDGLIGEFMAESMVKSKSLEPQCAMPPPYEPKELEEFLKRKKSLVKQVDTMRKGFLRSKQMKLKACFIYTCFILVLNLSLSL